MKYEWLEDENWKQIVIRDQNDDKKAFCKACNKSFVATSKTKIEEHCGIQSHKANINKKNASITDFFKPVP